jgi:benzoyl-CoA 2,3-dioxygenase component B
MVATISNEKIPNNVNLSSDKRLQRALEQWQPNFLSWWKDMGPEGFQEKDTYLRTAVSVDVDGWAIFDHVKMPDYRWGIFLAEPEPNRAIPMGDNFGQPAWQEVPGEHRNALRRLIVTQGDTEPASVEQQRLLAQTAPSLYDMRNLFQVNVEEGRHLWAMVYLLHSYFGSDGREEADELLQRRSGNVDKPRILTTFNEPISDWLSFFMFTTFTDRDGKYQLKSLAESGFDPLSRTCRFMLTEEAHHMFVGQTSVRRVIKRACEMMKEHNTDDIKKFGGVPLQMIQKYINFWYTSSLDLFGNEISTNAAAYFASGLKGRADEKKYTDHVCKEGVYNMDVLAGDKIAGQEIPLRNAMNEILRDDYVADCEKVLEKWNQETEDMGVSFTFSLPSRRFHRKVGQWSEATFDPKGNLITQAEYDQRHKEWLPTEEDRAHVRSLMKQVTEPGKMANWIAPPVKGINDKSAEFEYVKL